MILLTPDDDLARAYLHARDVRCPGCRYNRRDGTGAVCPECGWALTLGPVSRGTAAAATAAAVWLFVAMLAFGGIGTGLTGWVLVIALAFGGTLDPTESAIFLAEFAAFIVPLAMGVWGLRTVQSPLRRGTAGTRELRRIRAAGIAFLACIIGAALVPLVVVLLD